jgi:hypothetical protein
MKKFPFKELLGKLSYISEKLRHDIKTAIGTVSSFGNNPGIEHWNVLVEICGYLKNTSTLKLVLDGNSKNPQLTAYADANLADGVNEVRSRSGGVIFYGNCLIRSISKRQTEVSTNTAGAEILALHQVVNEVRYFRGMLSELTGRKYGPTNIFDDNKAVLDLMEAPGKRTKHHELRIASIREQQEFGNIQIIKIGSESNISDINTKRLRPTQFLRFRYAMGFRE